MKQVTMVLTVCLMAMISCKTANSKGSKTSGIGLEIGDKRPSRRSDLGTILYWREGVKLVQGICPFEPVLDNSNSVGVFSANGQWVEVGKKLVKNPANVSWAQCNRLRVAINFEDAKKFVLERRASQIPDSIGKSIVLLQKEIERLESRISLVKERLNALPGVSPEGQQSLDQPPLPNGQYEGRQTDNKPQPEQLANTQKSEVKALEENVAQSRQELKVMLRLRDEVGVIPEKLINDFFHMIESDNYSDYVFLTDSLIKEAEEPRSDQESRGRIIRGFYVSGLLLRQAFMNLPLLESVRKLSRENGTAYNNVKKQYWGVALEAKWGEDLQPIFIHRYSEHEDYFYADSQYRKNKGADLVDYGVSVVHRRKQAGCKIFGDGWSEPTWGELTENAEWLRGTKIREILGDHYFRFHNGHFDSSVADDLWEQLTRASHPQVLIATLKKAFLSGVRWDHLHYWGHKGDSEKDGPSETPLAVVCSCTVKEHNQCL